MLFIKKKKKKKNHKRRKAFIHVPLFLFERRVCEEMGCPTTLNRVMCPGFWTPKQGAKGNMIEQGLEQAGSPMERWPRTGQVIPRTGRFIWFLHMSREDIKQRCFVRKNLISNPVVKVKNKRVNTLKQIRQTYHCIF